MNPKKREAPKRMWYNVVAKKIRHERNFSMNIITQEAKKRQAIVKFAIKKAKTQQADNTE